MRRRSISGPCHARALYGLASERSWCDRTSVVGGANRSEKNNVKRYRLIDRVIYVAIFTGVFMGFAVVGSTTGFPPSSIISLIVCGAISFGVARLYLARYGRPRGMPSR